MPGRICNAAVLTAMSLRALSYTTILLTASCASAPQRDAVSMTRAPTQWSTNPPVNNPITTQWLSTFADPELRALAQDALNNNYELKAAAARVDSAREQARIDGAARWPQLSFAPGYRRDALTAIKTDAFEALFTMRWEIDVWGAHQQGYPTNKDRLCEQSEPQSYPVVGQARR